MVQALVGDDFAYITPKAVYFNVGRAKDYNKLNKQNLGENREGAGAGEVQDPDKENPHDFALWFFKTGVHQAALQTWPSSFESSEVADGRGFPGWHIECSAMIKALLGETIDIHMGGVEHISIHHTNEIAQSESVNNAPLANFWIHNEHLLVDDKKMAKSEGTGYSLAEVVEKGYDPLDLRYLFLQAHYRSQQNFTWEGLDAARTARGRLLSIVRGLQTGEESSVIDEKIAQYGEYRNQFTEALNDDFNIPQALAVLWEVAKSSLAPAEKHDLLMDFDSVLGLGMDRSQEKPNEEVQKLVEQRSAYRKEGKFVEADHLKKEIEEMGYTVKDTPGGPMVVKK
jgi:cysteinyl-tRNA synthetase